MTSFGGVLETTMISIEMPAKEIGEQATGKTRKELAKKGLKISRRRIGRIMKQEGLVSSYTEAQFKVH